MLLNTELFFQDNLFSPGFVIEKPDGTCIGVGTMPVERSLPSDTGVRIIMRIEKVGDWRFRAKSARQRFGRPLAELLEARRLLAMITVTSAGDADGADGSSTISLRQAIEISNGSLGVGSLTMGQASLVVGTLSTPNTIDFDIPGAGPFTITPATNLPTITNPLVINGYTQPGAQPNTDGPTQADNAILKIELIGSTGTSTGLQITAGNSTVEGLSIGGFATAGIELNSTVANLDTSSNLIAGDFLGIDTTGTHPIPSSQVGLLIAQAVSNTIGGTTAAARDVISGNSAANLGIYDASEDNLVEGNLIGTDATGAVAFPNQINGIDDLSSGSNTIGGTFSGARNVISGNGNSGVYLSAVSDVVEGNYIGTDITGSTPIQNGGDGVDVENVGSDTIGGSTAGAGNVISGNNLTNTYKSALYVAAPGNLIEGNLIGTDATGTKVLSGHNGQVWIASGQANTIGGTVAGARNVISTEVDGASLLIDTSDNLIEGNFIGTDITGTVALPGFGGEIAILTGPSNTIGGTAIGAGNVISCSGGYGLVIGSASNLVEGNRIGTDVTGTVDLPNVDGGIEITVSAVGAFGGFNTIGGTIPGVGNIISGNGGDGIDLTVGYLLIQGNRIGTDISGSLAIPNQVYGIDDEVGGSCTIGGTVPGAGNLISGNGQDGVELLGSSDSIEGNRIGTDITGTFAVPNGLSGIALGSGTVDTIGGTASGAGNLISGNPDAGIDVSNLHALIEGNLIGTDVTGTEPIPNGEGIRVGSYGGPTIGGTTPGARNVISGNTNTGIDLVKGGGLMEGNFIGTDVSGTKALPNGMDGIIDDGFSTIGGTTTGAGNVISSNSHDGIFIDSPQNLIEGNFIGTDASGTKALPNLVGIGDSFNGGYLVGQLNTIGGTTATARNVISGNISEGIELSDSDTLIEGNFIGTDATGTKTLPNQDSGILVQGGLDIVIGGTVPGAGNLISGNADDGISINSSGTLVEGT